MVKHELNSKQMRKLYNTLRSKGYNKEAAFKKTGKAKILSKRYYNNPSKMMKFNKKHSYLDYDGDGKVNKYDCYPFDKKRQDAQQIIDESDTVNSDMIKDRNYIRREKWSEGNDTWNITTDKNKDDSPRKKELKKFFYK